eukprot:TRINITY_DN1267_c0_g1_i1.p2 TRINITY_DN1267_c0_g1~~TRINITY_DN1267_c0_g1_i1.p2  ORF type:complete len:140 (+),score=2.33 TRINITY_DN1267_c0_g1_i1:154-573(+)
MSAIKRYQRVGVPATEFFCPRCGTLLIRHNTRRSLICMVDGYEKDLTSDFTNTYSLTKLDVQALRQREDLQSFEEKAYVKTRSDVKDGALDMQIAEHEICEKCGTPGLQYYTRQMRSADEGQTVFFKCLKCKYVLVVQS